MKVLTVRNISADLASALETRKRRSGTSMNRTVLRLLTEALGIATGRGRRNGLADFAGSWDQEDLEKFESAVAPFEQIDEELWR